MGGRSGRHRRRPHARGLARRPGRIWSAALGRLLFSAALSLRGRSRLGGSRRNERPRGRARSIGGAPSRDDGSGRGVRRRGSRGLGLRAVAPPKPGARRADRLSDRGRRGGKRSWPAAGSQPRGVRPRSVRQSRLGRFAPRADRADGRPKNSRRALAAHSRSGARGAQREPRRYRRRGVSLRHRRHAARNASIRDCSAHDAPGQPLRVGVGGPVGSGKTALMEQLCKRLRDGLEHRGDHQRHLHQRRRPHSGRGRSASSPSGSSASRPAAARIPRSARTPRSTSRRSSEMRRRFADLDLILIELGGDNLAATFSPELADSRSMSSMSRAARKYRAKAARA